MKPFLFVMFLVAALSATLVLGQEAPVAPAATTATGRYQLVMVGSPGSVEVWMLDSQTGDTWRRAAGTTRWTYAGNPTQDPGKVVPAARAATRPAATRPQVELP